MVAKSEWLLVGLSTSRTYKGLSVSMKVGGFEALDLISCLILAAILNMFLGRATLAPVFVICLPMMALSILHLSKRGKPEGHLQHLIKYSLTYGCYLANEKSSYDDQMSLFIYE